MTVMFSGNTLGHSLLNILMLYVPYKTMSKSAKYFFRIRNTHNIYSKHQVETRKILPISKCYLLASSGIDYMIYKSMCCVYKVIQPYKKNLCKFDLES